MKLIVWLGNPWKKYEQTRHNLGFLFLDYLRKEKDFLPFLLETKFKWEITSGIINGEKIILLKPQTFMNLSGESIKKCADFYKIKNDDICIIYDDISMDFGKIRSREKWSAGWHNGIKDIIRLFWETFLRIKFGIGYKEHYDVSDWVLSKFSKKEIKELEEKYFSLLKEELLKNI